MQIKDSEIAEFQKLYKKRFGVELNYDLAYAKLSALVRQVETIYRPITKAQLVRLLKGDKNDN